MLIDVPCCTVVSGSPADDIRGSVEQLQRNVEIEIKLHMEALDTKGKNRKEAVEPSSRFSPGAVMVDIATRYLMSLIDDGSFEPPRSWSVEVTRNYLLPRAVAA